MSATATPRKRERETYGPDGYDAFARRTIKGLAKRAASGDLEALTALNDLKAYVDQVAAEIAVPGLRSEEGGSYAYSEIGQALGITRQAAQLRYPNAKGARCGGSQPAHLR